MAEDFRQLQRSFAAHIRDPEGVSAPEGIEDRRMAIYRELFFGNIRSLLSNGFPVLGEVLGEARWTRLVRDFFRGHRCETPLFHEIAGEFVTWLAEERDVPDDPPWLAELAHYEWVELALAVAEGQPPEDDPAADALAGHARLSPLAWVLGYAWPVHRIAPGHLPDSAQPVWLLVHRDARDEIGFSELAPATAMLLERIGRQPGSRPRDLLRDMAGELGLPPEQALAHGRETLEALRAQGVIGITKSP